MSSGRERDDRERRALEDLRRARSGSESVFGGSLGRAAEHFAGADAPEGDAIELWGRRIGRVLSAIAVVVLLYYLAATYL